MEKDTKSIRFGIIADNENLKQWEHDAVQALLALPQVSLNLRITLASTAQKPPAANYLLWRSYLKFFYKPILTSENRGVLPQNAPLVTYSAHPQDGSEPATLEAATALIREAKLDLILSFASSTVMGPILSCPRYGVWAFEHGKVQNTQSLSLGLREIYCHEPTTSVALRRVAADGPGAVLQHGVFRTQLHSPSQAADGLYAECARWPADVCRQLLAGLALPSLAPEPRATGPAGSPTNAAVLAFAARVAKYKLQNLYRTFLRADQWNMGVVNRPIRDFLRPGGLQGAVVDAPPLPNRNVFYADSFARQEAEGTVVYFELYDWRTRRGNISRLPYPWQPGRAPATVLSFPHHLSYPFPHGPYCIPEAWVTNSVRMYDLRAPVTDPLAGQVLLEAPAVDTTLLEHEGRHWLFYTRADYDPMLHLFISYADALEGPWHDHPQNPVKINIRSARPAGPFFKEGGKLYRPTQDCIRDYGAALTFNEVLTLTPTAYEEREVANVLSPHPGYPAGMHTVMAIDDAHTLIDFKRYRFIPMATLTMVWIRVAGLLQRLKGGR